MKFMEFARLVNEGFFAEGGRIRGVPVTIGGSSYVPPLPNELDVKDRIREFPCTETKFCNERIKTRSFFAITLA